MLFRPLEGRQLVYLTVSLGYGRKEDRHKGRLIPKYTQQVGPRTKRDLSGSRLTYGQLLDHSSGTHVWESDPQGNLTIPCLAPQSSEVGPS